MGVRQKSGTGSKNDGGGQKSSPSYMYVSCSHIFSQEGSVEFDTKLNMIQTFLFIIFLIVGVTQGNAFIRCFTS